MKRHVSIFVLLLNALALTACNDASAVPPTATAFEAAMTQAGSGDTGPVPRRVWAGVPGALDFSCGGPSPDGKLFSLVDWGTGDLAVYDLEAGAVRRLTNKGSWNENGSWNECSVFSADGKSVLFNYGNAASGVDGHVYELRALDLADPAESQKTVMQLPPNLGRLVAADWRGEEMLAVSCAGADEPNQLVAVSGETRRVIKEAESDVPFPARYSPDGTVIAYQLGDKIRLIGRDGTNDRDSDLGDARLIGWARSGALIYQVASAREFRSVEFEAGSTNEPVVIQGDLTSVYPLGIAGNTIFYGVAVESRRIHTATIDWENGRASEPVPLLAAIDGTSGYPAWSPDGRSLAYTHRPLGSRTAGIMLRSTQGNEVRELTELTMKNPSNLVWDSAGDALWLRGDGDEDHALYRVDAHTGEVSKVFEGMGHDLAVGPDGTLFFFRRPAAGVEPGLHAYDPDSGATRLIVGDSSRQGGRNIEVSPDGAKIAYTRFDNETKVHSLLVVDVEGGPPREILRVPAPGYLTTIAQTMVWSPDGQKLVYRRASDDKQVPSTLEMISVDSGVTTVLYEGDAPLHVRLHPDGRRLAMATGQEKSELWTLELRD